MPISLGRLVWLAVTGILRRKLGSVIAIGRRRDFNAPPVGSHRRRMTAALLLNNAADRGYPAKRFIVTYFARLSRMR